MRKDKETGLSVDQLTSFIDFAKNQPMTASRISYCFGLYVDEIIETADQNPDKFKQETDEDGQIYYSLQKENQADSRPSQNPFSNLK
jgi:hypothetical protein